MIDKREAFKAFLTVLGIAGCLAVYCLACYKWPLIGLVFFGLWIFSMFVFMGVGFYNAAIEKKGKQK